MKKVATSKKSKSHNRERKTRNISVLWVFDRGLQDALLILISLNRHESWSSFILNFVSKFEGWSGRHFYGRPLAALGLVTPLGITTHVRIHNNFSSFFWVLASGPPKVASGPLSTKFSPLAQTYSCATGSNL